VLLCGLETKLLELFVALLLPLYFIIGGFAAQPQRAIPIRHQNMLLSIKASFQDLKEKGNT
jgi:hypothetical protein